MPRLFVIAVLLAVAATSWALPVLWGLAQSYLTEGHGLHPFLAGGLAVGICACTLGLVAMLLNHPGR